MAGDLRCPALRLHCYIGIVFTELADVVYLAHPIPLKRRQSVHKKPAAAAAVRQADSAHILCVSAGLSVGKKRVKSMS